MLVAACDSFYCDQLQQLWIGFSREELIHDDFAKAGGNFLDIQFTLGRTDYIEARGKRLVENSGKHSELPGSEIELAVVS